MEKIKFLMTDTGRSVTELCRETLEKRGVDVAVCPKDGAQDVYKRQAGKSSIVLRHAGTKKRQRISNKRRPDAARPFIRFYQ